MLTHIHIRNFTIIDELDLDFAAGMTVLTGETGAGKSIIIDALALSLGGRADTSIIRPGNERCEITTSFDLQKMPAALQWLHEQEIDAQDECLLRRTINSDGRSRCSINGQPVTLQQAREFGSLLVNIHGQHEHQFLLKPEKQRQLLDAYAGHASLLGKVKTAYQYWQQAMQEFKTLQAQTEQRQARYELLHYQTQELAVLALSQDEFVTLEKEHKQLANAERLLANCHQALGVLADDEQQSILRLLNTAHHAVLEAQAMDPALSSVSELLNNAIIETQEASNELHHYLDRVDLNPERLQIVEQRLASIYEMARKHRVAPEELPRLQQDLTKELAQLTQNDERLSQLQETIQHFAADYHALAKQLSKSREKAAKKLSQLIETSMHSLAMPGGRFTVQFTPLETNQWSVYGLERVEFMVSANPGQPLQALNKVVSGGELSRISLAIQVITAQSDATPTLIFDEVDVGIGGGTAAIVGQLLRTLGQSAQVLCVTHLPQVAAQGHHHLQIGKHTTKGITFTRVRALNQEEKIQEIARMLGGLKITEQTLAHAREMLETA